MWSSNINFRFKEKDYVAEVLLQERDLSYGEDVDGNRAQNQQSIKIIEINTITDADDEKIYNFDDFEFKFIDSISEHESLWNLIEEIGNRGELC